MNDMTEAGCTVDPRKGLEILKAAKAAIYQAFEGQGDSPASAVSAAIVGYENALQELESIATKYERMARAVLVAWEWWQKYKDFGHSTDYHRQDELAAFIEQATGKHPSEWTRDGLMEWLGIAQEPKSVQGFVKAPDDVREELGEPVAKAAFKRQEESKETDDE